jgi:hypothetical protein
MNIVRIYIKDSDRKVGAMLKALAVEVDGFTAVKGTTKKFLSSNGYYTFSFKTSQKARDFKETVMTYLSHTLEVSANSN